MQGKIRILIVEDHPVMRLGLTKLLESQNDMELVGTAENGTSAILKAAELMPDVIVLDLVLPDMDGPEVILRIKENDGDTHIIVFSSYSYGEIVHQAIKAGASGFVVKDQPPEEILHAIREVSLGFSVMSPVIQKELVYFIQKHEKARDLKDLLSPRELEILSLMVKGLTDKEIASQASLSEGTIRVYISKTFFKLGVANRNQAMLLALRQGISDLDYTID
jgi:DNA-binding NarL/FixJ family response regulator